MRNIKLTIKYDGSKYHGWQRLKKTDMTIQGKLETLLTKMTGEKIEINGSGRTDAGVHAFNQIANFKTNIDMTTAEIMDYCNKYLPQDILVKKVEEVDDRFHARYNVKGKKYLYKIYNKKYQDPFSRGFVTHVPENLRLESMREAAAYLIGEYDFTSFSTTRSKKKSSIREIYSIDIVHKGEVVEIMLHGNGFLYNMVRIIVGTLIEVGVGRMKPSQMKDILNEKDRKLAGPTAPPEGLFLYEVEYE